MSMYVRYGKDTRHTVQEFMVSPGVGTLMQLPARLPMGGPRHQHDHPDHGERGGDRRGPQQFRLSPRARSQDSHYFRTSSLNPPTLRPFPTGDSTRPICRRRRSRAARCRIRGRSFRGTPATWPATTTFPIPYSNFNDTYTFKDDLSKVIGSHSLKTGVYYEYNSKIEPASGNLYAGLFNFGSNVNNPLDTGHGYANALLGNFQTYTEASNRLVPNPHFTEVEGYIQDNWRVNRRFTLDYGVRFYHMGVMQDNANSYSGFYPQSLGSQAGGAAFTVRRRLAARPWRSTRLPAPPRSPLCRTRWSRVRGMPSTA